MGFLVGLALLIGGAYGLYFFLDELIGSQSISSEKYWTVSGGILALFILWNAIIIVPVGSTYVGVWFGTVQQTEYTAGLQLVNPMMGFTRMDVRQINAEFESVANEGTRPGDNVVTAVSKNNLPLTVDVTYMFRLNPKWAWWVYANYGNDTAYLSNLIKRVAQTATKNATANFTDEEATTSKRLALAEQMRSDFQSGLVANIMEQGLKSVAAKEVFQIMPAQLSKVLPPQQVIDAISNKAAASQDLERQKTLTLIAMEVANRRAQEGEGVNKLFEKLPRGFTAEQISHVLRALADKTRSDAELKAVETGKVNAMVFSTAGAMPAVTVPSGSPAQ